MSKVDSTPATKADLDKAVDELATATNEAIKMEVGSLRGEMGEMRSEMGEMKEQMATKTELAEVKDLSARTMQVVESIDERLKNAGDIGARLDKLEERSFSR